MCLPVCLSLLTWYLKEAIDINFVPSCVSVFTDLKKAIDINFVSSCVSLFTDLILKEGHWHKFCVFLCVCLYWLAIVCLSLLTWYLKKAIDINFVSSCVSLFTDLILEGGHWHKFCVFLCVSLYWLDTWRRP